MLDQQATETLHRTKWRAVDHNWAVLFIVRTDVAEVKAFRQIIVLKQNNPRLAEALETSPEEFAKILKEQQQARLERERAKLRLATADPMDLEAQRLIAEEIANKNIEQNMEMAMEYSPESFGTVVMLYIDCMVNGHPIKA